MGEVHFYHLTRSAAEVALVAIAEKALERGWQVGVVAPDQTQAEGLDQRLWVVSEEGFVPHGLAGGPHDNLQPILIVGGVLPDARPCLMSVGGADLEIAALQAAERGCILFDGNDGTAVERARSQWRALTGAGLAAIYWSEESGRWQKKAESPAKPGPNG